eukprot:32325-Eustigmatos_ZCMA.PRE.1
MGNINHEQGMYVCPACASQLQRETVDSLKPAVWEMRGISELKSPKDMIDCLLNVAKHITRQLVHAREGGSRC